MLQKPLFLGKIHPGSMDFIEEWISMIALIVEECHPGYLDFIETILYRIINVRCFIREPQGHIQKQGTALCYQLYRSDISLPLGVMLGVLQYCMEEELKDCMDHRLYGRRRVKRKVIVAGRAFGFKASHANLLLFHQFGNEFSSMFNAGVPWGSAT